MDPELARSVSAPRNLDVREIDLAARLRARRLAAGMSRQDLADRAGVSERSIRDIENGKRPRVQDKTVMLLAEALGCEPGDLAALPPVPTVPPGGPPGDVAAWPDTAPPPKPRWPLVVSVALAGVMLLAAGVLWFAVDRAAWEVVEGELVMSDAVLRHELWRISERPAVRLVAPAPWDHGKLLVGFNGTTADGDQAWLVQAATGEKLAGYPMDIEPVRRAFGDEILAEGQDFGCSEIRPLDVDGDGTAELAIRYTHGKYYPTGVACFEADGTRLGLYVHRGHLGEFHIEDLDGDGRDELLCLGTNNDPVYQGGTVVYLEEGAWGGASVDPPSGPGRGPVGDIADGARYRVVFPAFTQPVMTQLNRVRLDAYGVRTHRMDDGALRIMLTVGIRSLAGVSVVCDGRLRPLLANPTDSMVGVARTWGPPYDLPGEFPSEEYLALWLQGARWSSSESNEVVWGPVR